VKNRVDGYCKSSQENHKQFSYTNDSGDYLTDKTSTNRVPADREQYLQTIIETTGDGFWVVDTAGRIVETNEAYCRM